jgi:5-methylcytosine-specific restriction endonuclease McrA
VIAASRARKKIETDRKRVWVAQYFKDHPCVDCGETDLLVLEFDHLRDKKFSISRLIQDGSQKRLEDEIAKCEVACANCHRRRTARRNNSWRLGAVV